MRISAPVMLAAADQTLGVGIMRIENGYARGRVLGAVEEEFLGGEILLHGLVIVEVVAGEVGEDGDVEWAVRHAALVESVAGDLRDELGCAAGDAFGHELEKISGLGGGVDGGTRLTGHVVFDGADEDCFAGGGVEEELP